MGKEEKKDIDALDKSETVNAGNNAADSASGDNNVTTVNGNLLKRGYNVTDGGMIFSLVIVFYILINIVAIIFLQSSGDASASFGLSITLTVIVEISMLFIWFMYGRSQKINYVKASRVNRDMSWTKLVKTLAIIGALFGFAILIEYFLVWFCKVISYEPAGMAIQKEWQLFVMLPVITILPAICEEFIFRGVILPSLESKGKWNAILISAALFALMHMNFGQTIYQFLLGVVLGYLVITFRTIWVGVIGHFVSNGLAMLRTIAGYYEFGFVMEIILFSLAGVCLIAVIAYIVLKVKSPQNSKKPDILTIDEIDKSHEKTIDSEVIEGAAPATETAKTVAPLGRRKGREAVFLSYFGGIGVSLIIWIVDLITKVS